MVVRAISQRAPGSLRPQQDDGRRERHRPLYSQGHAATNPPSGDGGDVRPSLTRAAQAMSVRASRRVASASPSPVTATGTTRAATRPTGNRIVTSSATLERTSDRV